MDEAKNNAEETAIQENASTEEKNDTVAKSDDTEQKTDAIVEEKIEVSKKELERLQKVDKDFSGIIEKRRLEKLSKKNKQENPVEENNDNIHDVDYITEIAREEARKIAAEIIQNNNRDKYDDNLKAAYGIFIKNNNWADDDEVITAISNEFNPGQSIEVNDLVKKLDTAALSIFPDRYKKHIEEKTKAQLFAQNHAIEVGSAGSGTGQTGAESTVDVTITDEDRKIADKFFDGDLQRYLKYRQNN